MENLINKIENELNSLSKEEKEEILKKLRNEIDSIDNQIVPLLSKRTLMSVLIGRVKRSMNLPTYSPEREKEISKKISYHAEEPLRPESLLRIYERILDESRAIQREEKNEGNIFRISTSKMKKSLKSIFSKKEFLIITIFFFVLLGWLYYIFFTPNYYSGKSPVRFEITKGESLDQITESLYEHGLIPNRTSMKVAAFLYGAEKRIRAGRYNIPNGLSYLDLIELFLYGKADFLVNVKLYDGSRIKSMAATLKVNAFIDSAAFVDVCNDREFLDSIGLDYPTIEGYLLPRQYSIYERSSAREVIKKIYNGFNSFFNDSLKARAKELGYSIHDIVTLASIIEGETKKKEDMAVIAEVYYNRLKRGMRLEADPTIQYLIKGKWRRLLYRDLKTSSPYNTYMNYGLPPGPINNPGKPALLAALYPDNNNYLYFVADGDGGHKFSSTYSEHLKNVREYRRWLRAQESK
ncbi:MAG: endolytic transglycosylase MltG [Ignavibacteriaceae bacterium]